MDTATAVLRILDLVEAGASTYDRVVATRDRVAAISASGREPSSAEWEELFGQIEADSARLEAASNRFG